MENQIKILFDSEFKLERSIVRNKIRFSYFETSVLFSLEFSEDQQVIDNDSLYIKFPVGDHITFKISLKNEIKEFLTISNRGGASIKPPDYRLICFRVFYVSGFIKGRFFLRIINLGIVRINMNKIEVVDKVLKGLNEGIKSF